MLGQSLFLAKGLVNDSRSLSPVTVEGQRTIDAFDALLPRLQQAIVDAQAFVDSIPPVGSASFSFKGGLIVNLDDQNTKAAAQNAVDQTIRFVDVVFPDLRQKALNGDAAAGQRLLNAAQGILGDIQTLPADLAPEDASRLVADMAKTLAAKVDAAEKNIIPIGTIIAVVVVAIAIIVVATRVPRST